jgi:hypothetical protein
MPEVKTADMNARISVIVLTHNRVHEVTRTVERLLALPETSPVIVADNGSLRRRVLARNAALVAWLRLAAFGGARSDMASIFAAHP